MRTKIALAGIAGLVLLASSNHASAQRGRGRSGFSLSSPNFSIGDGNYGGYGGYSRGYNGGYYSGYYGGYNSPRYYNNGAPFGGAYNYRPYDSGYRGYGISYFNSVRPVGTFVQSDYGTVPQSSIASDQSASPGIDAIAVSREQSSYFDPNNVTAMPVSITIMVPNDQTQLWFGSTATTERGTLRTFVSPAIEPGRDYAYTIRAQWTEDGQNVVRTKNLTVVAGKSYTVDFRMPATSNVMKPTTIDRLESNQKTRTPPPPGAKQLPAAIMFKRIERDSSLPPNGMGESH